MSDKYKIVSGIANRIGANPHQQITAKNGRVIALTKTAVMADRVVRGLKLLDEHEFKMKHFRI